MTGSCSLVSMYNEGTLTGATQDIPTHEVLELPLSLQLRAFYDSIGVLHVDHVAEAVLQGLQRMSVCPFFKRSHV